ncbi:DEAD/DEAH box helicase [Amycolatopsis sp. MJM2582]|uniref:DEAD/DEAH box helicase n=1 Tax=Amycolatopsis sp. MJM2582 TaxID=1427749 RepID=UPI001F425A3D|nr:DEAD/DEAH box helicase [Amycolatopsis sp. MJM2582]
MAGGGRGQLRTACGTGKTHMAMWTAQRLPVTSGVVVVVAPTVGLVTQILRSWAAHDQHHTALAVCGDDTVLPDSAVTVDDITEPVTTDPDVVAHWLRSAPADQGIRLIVGTHLSAHIVGEGLQKAQIVADLLVVDEAHHTVGAADKHSALVHDDEILPALRRLYLTATARILSPAQRAARAARGTVDHTHSMDQESVYGPVLYRYSTSQAIADGYLDNFQLAVIGVARSEVAALLRRALARGGKQPRLHTAMVHTAIARAARSYGLRRIVAFCSRVADAATFADTYTSTLDLLPDTHQPDRPLHTAHVHGGMSAAEREAVLRTLDQPPDDGWTVVSNVACLSEGVDVPALDCVAFTSPKRSTVDIVQAVGRALRPNPHGSGTATILVPILLPDDNTDDVDPGDFEQLWEVIRALRAHDDILASALDHSRAHGFRDTDQLPRISVDLPAGYDDDGTFLRHLTVQLVKSATTPWWDGYARVAAYHAAHGTIGVAQTFVHDGFSLGRWLDQARKAHRLGRLLPEQIAALEKLGIVWDPAAEPERLGRDAVRRFHAASGDLRPTFDFVDDTGFPLYQWLARCRQKHRRGQMSDELYQFLSEHGMVWDPIDDKWNTGLAVAKVFHDSYGHLRVPVTHQAHDSHGRPYDLRAFLDRCRSNRRHGKLSAARVAELDALGIEWTPNDTAWKKSLAALTTYHDQHGDLNVSGDRYVVDGVNITDILWVARRDYADGTLAASRIADLEALGIDWTPGKWGRLIETLRAYHAEHGNIDVPHDFRAHNCNVRVWLGQRRRDRKAGVLTDDQIATLDALGMNWGTYANRERLWAESFAQAQRFHAAHGHLRPGNGKNTSDEEAALYQWLNAQRRLFARGKLSPERVAALESLDIDWNPLTRKELLWQQAYEGVKAFHAEHGHLAIASDPRHPERRALSKWLGHQRSYHANGTLSAERVAKLTELGMDWRVLSSGDRAWEIRFTEAMVYHARHGSLADIPRGHTTSTGFGLECWLRTCQRAAGTGDLTPDRKNRLAALGVVFAPGRRPAEAGAGA